MYETVTQAVPLHFPSSAQVPESLRHAEVRFALFALLRYALPNMTVGSDQFMYWDPTDPKRCVAPDVWIFRANKQTGVTSWKTWERGVPELAVEIISHTDRGASNWAKTLRSYEALGVQELVRFDDEESDRMIHVWQRQDGRLVEQTSLDSSVLDGTWTIKDDEGPALWLAHNDGQLWMTEAEAAQARIRELEAELAHRH